MKLAPASENLWTVILKTANFCSLGCDYCYVRPHAANFSAQIMPLRMVRKVITDYAALAARQRGADEDNRTIKITWHGGEPLMAGLPYFQRAVDLEESLVTSPARVVNSITTNGVPLDEDWVEFFKEHRFQVAVSLDGPEEIHNAHRRYPEGAGSFDAVMKGIHLLRSFGVHFGVLTVITKELARVPERYFDFCVEHGLKNIAFIPYTTTSEWLPVTDFADFSIRFFDLWYESDDPQFYVRDFANIISKIFGRESSLCEYRSCFGNYLCVDTTGDVYMCDLLIGNKDMFLGNIMETSLQDLLDSPKYTELKALARTSSQSCDACELFPICTGGCMYRRYLGSRGLPGKDIYCTARQKLIAHIFNRLEESEKLASTLNRSNSK